MLAHLKSRRERAPLNQWSEEVHAARQIREQNQSETSLPPATTSDKLLENAIEAGKILEQHRLDGRDLSSNPSQLRKANPLLAVKSLVRWSVFFLFLPLFLLSLGFQLLMGRILGDNTDEGLDARTSYQFLAAMFGSMIVWPLASLLLVGVLMWQSASIESLTGVDWMTFLGTSRLQQTCTILIVILVSLPLFWISGHSFAWAWDDFVDTRKAWNRKMMPKSEKQRLHTLIQSMVETLESR